MEGRRPSETPAKEVDKEAEEGPMPQARHRAKERKILPREGRKVDTKVKGGKVDG